MRIEIKITRYEDDNDDLAKDFRMQSHYLDDRVQLEFDGETVTVLASDLKKAADRCSGWKY